MTREGDATRCKRIKWKGEKDIDKKRERESGRE